MIVFTQETSGEKSTIEISTDMATTQFVTVAFRDSNLTHKMQINVYVKEC